MPGVSARQQTIPLLNEKVLETRITEVLQTSDESTFEPDSKSQSTSTPESENDNETTMLLMEQCVDSLRHFAPKKLEV